MLSTYLSAHSSTAEGIKLVSTATAVTTGSRGLKARVHTEPHVRSGKAAKFLLSRKTAEQEYGGKHKIRIPVDYYQTCLPKTPLDDSNDKSTK